MRSALLGSVSNEVLHAAQVPVIRESADGRVITMSSGGMYSSGFDFDDPQLENTDYKPTAFYAQTKRAEVMLTQGWAEREGDDGPYFLAMHQGVQYRVF